MGRSLRLLAKLLAFMVLTALPLGHAQPRQVSPRLCAASEKAAVRPLWRGNDGWLFGRPDLITAAELPETAPLYLERLAEALRARGVTPVALIVPTRGSVAYRHMQRTKNPALARYDPEAAARGYRNFLGTLRKAGFIAPDLLGVARRAGDSFFFKRDHHWTPAAARAVAQAVAEELETKLKTQLAALPKTSFHTRSRPPKRQLGTLARRAQARCPATALPRERVAQFETRPERTPERTDVPVAEALFAEQTPQIVLVGTSNSHRDAGKPGLNFGGFLQAALGLEVLNAAFPGSGVYGSLESYLRSKDFRRTPPKVLIWETLLMSWQRRPSLPDEQRQVLPSVYGPCQNPLARRKLRTLQKGTNKLIDAPDGRRKGLYLHLTLNDRALVKFRVLLRYPARTERVQIARTTRVPNTGEFYLDLGADASLKALALDLPKAASGGARVSICRAPP